MDNKNLGSQPDEVSENEPPEESNDLIHDITNDDVPDNDKNDVDDHNNDDNVKNMINEVMEKFDNKVLPGLMVVLSMEKSTVRRSTRKRKEVKWLMFMQTKHLEMHHNLLIQNNNTCDMYTRVETTIVTQFIKKIASPNRLF